MRIWDEDLNQETEKWPSKSLFRRSDLAVGLILPVVVPSTTPSPAPAASPAAPVTTASSVSTAAAVSSSAAASAPSMLVTAPSAPAPLPSAVGVLVMIALLIVMSRLVTGVVILMFSWQRCAVFASLRRFFRIIVLYIPRRHRRLMHRLRFRILKVSCHQFYQLRDVIFGASHNFVEKNLRENFKQL